MPSRRVPITLNAGTYYLTLTVERWYYLFDRFNRWQILADSLRYCQENKGLQLRIWLKITSLNYCCRGDFNRLGRMNSPLPGLCSCSKNREVVYYRILNGYVFMLNHIHLIVTSPDVAGFLRDFKRFTSKQLRNNLQNHEPRVLALFVDKEDVSVLAGDKRPKENREFGVLSAKTELFA